MCPFGKPIKFSAAAADTLDTVPMVAIFVFVRAARPATTKGERTMFNVERWVSDMKKAIAAKDAETLSRLMYENDRNGCFSYDAVISEGGEMTKAEWADSTIAYAIKTLDDMPNHTEPRFLVRDESGRGWAATTLYSEFTTEERDHVEDEEEPEDTFGDWLDNASVGDEYRNTDQNFTVIRVD
jgi:hypothetical protein